MVLRLTINKASPAAAPTPPEIPPSTAPESIGGPEDVATIVVDGRNYTDWESVTVQQDMSGTNGFTFTSVEREPIPGLWSKLQLRPRQFADIYLGGQLAMQRGVIETRQVAYDAMRHHIQITGFSYGDIIGRSSVDVPDGSLDGKNFFEAAVAVLEKHNIGIKVIGNLNPRIFPQLQAGKGEKIWDFLENIARPRGIILGTDHLGNFLLIGQHTESVNAQLIEGMNILSCQCVITAKNAMAIYEEHNQSPASDDHNGTAASEMKASASGTGLETTKKITPSTFPVRSPDEAQEMVNNEAKWSEGTNIQAFITVNGWMMPGTKQLWRPRMNYSVYSPMAMLTDGKGGPYVMKAKAVTFTQDSQNGTLTTLELWKPWSLNDTRTGSPITSDEVINPQTNAPEQH